MIIVSLIKKTHPVGQKAQSGVIFDISYSISFVLQLSVTLNGSADSAGTEQPDEIKSFRPELYFSNLSFLAIEYAFGKITPQIYNESSHRANFLKDLFPNHPVSNDFYIFAISKSYSTINRRRN